MYCCAKGGMSVAGRPFPRREDASAVALRAMADKLAGRGSVDVTGGGTISSSGGADDQKETGTRA